MSAAGPATTYRVQLHGEWGFAEARAIVPFLKELGIEWLYCSPVLQARRGSTHGYDIVDPRRISDELGGEEEWARLMSALQSRGMGVLLDIVPNHMAIGPENSAWMDVLAHGRMSRYADWFDVAWPEEEDSRFSVPALGKRLEEAIDSGEVAIEFSDGGFVCRYYESAFPIEPGSWAVILRCAAQMAGDQGDSYAAAALEGLASIEVPCWRYYSEQAREARYERANELQRLLCAAMGGEVVLMREYIERAARDAPVRAVLERQPYRLCHWKEAMQRMAYRRFFDITHLIGVRVEDGAVFQQTHARILQLLADGAVDGLRIDHVDGLADPMGYLHKLREACAERNPFLVVEKILGSEETLPEKWPLAGTTGYEFINAVSGVFVDREGLERLASFQASLAGQPIDCAMLMYEEKRRAARELFGGEVAALARLLKMIAKESGIDAADEAAIDDAIVEVSARLPVYRTYISRADVRARRAAERDRALIERAMNEAPASMPGIGLLRRVLMLVLPADVSDETIERAAEFIVKWQQFTGPLAAKGVEDTALYLDARLVSLNEVGADAAHFERPGGVEAFHRHNASIAEHWPMTLAASSTHDTKRSEDVRARLHVLSEVADEWIAAVERWRRMNARHRTDVSGEEAPDGVAELFLYQNILGAWPVEETGDSEFTERMVSYAIKASREAKKRTSWIEPNEEYENAVTGFVRGILGCDEWRAEAERLLAKVVFPGAINSLSALVFKLASPGVADFYQGMELWDFSLVDPDNRRPVDYERRRRVLGEIVAMAEKPGEGAIADLLRLWRDGRIKMFVTHRGLCLRRKMRDVFLRGGYVPRRASGLRADHVCAFARRHEGRWVVATAAVRVARMIAEDGKAPGAEDWGDTSIELPEDAPIRMRDALTGRDLVVEGGRLAVGDALRHLPIALLYA